MTQAATNTALQQRSGGALTRSQAFNSVRDLLKTAESQLALALPKHIPVSYFIRIALTAVQRNPQLLECDRTTLLGAMFQAAQLGLTLDPALGQAYLVPFRNNKRTPPRLEVQFIPGYRGLIDLVRRSGQLSTVDAEVVRQKDHFRYTRGFNPVLEHVPFEGEGEAGPLTHVYAWCRLTDGGTQVKVMTARDVEKIRKRSRAATSGPWVTDPEWMWKKTAMRQLCKLLPMSTETQRAMHLDERAELDLPQDLGALVPGHEDDITPDDVDLETGEIVEMPRRLSETGTGGDSAQGSQESAAAAVSVPQPAGEPTPSSAAPTAPALAAAPEPARPRRQARAAAADDAPPPPKPKAHAQELPPGADRIVELQKSESRHEPGTWYWKGKTQRGVAFYSWDGATGMGLEHYFRTKDLCTLELEPPQGHGAFREVFKIRAWSATDAPPAATREREPGEEG